MSDDQLRPGFQPADFQTAFWAAKHDLAVATAAAFSRHGVHEGQQFILRLLWAEDGLAPGEIARRLGLSTHTVERHVANLYRKIGARGRADATAFAFRSGLA